MKRASVWLLSLGFLGCGTPAKPPASGSAQQTASTGSADEQALAANEPAPTPDSPPPSEPRDTPSPAAPAVVSAPGQATPTVPGVLPALPAPNLAAVVTLEKVQVGALEVALEAGALPGGSAPPKIVDALLASAAPVAWAADAGVPAKTLWTLIGVLPPDRARVLVMQTSKGKQGGVSLQGSAPAEAPQVRLGPDGFHLVEHSGGKEYPLGPDQAGDVFDYVELRNKAKSFRKKHPDVAGVRVTVDKGVTVEVLARALCALRGPKCAEEPSRCWLPEVAFGSNIKTASVASEKPKVELSKSPDDSNAPGTVKIGKAKAGKGVDASKIDAVLKRRSGFVRMCYFAALADAPALAGTMDVRLTLGADGRVIEIGFPESSLDDEAVEACLSRGLAGLRFAEQKTSPAAVDVSLTFAPRSPGESSVQPL